MQSLERGTPSLSGDDPSIERFAESYAEGPLGDRKRGAEEGFMGKRWPRKPNPKPNPGAKGLGPRRKRSSPFTRRVMRADRPAFRSSACDFVSLPLATAASICFSAAFTSASTRPSTDFPRSFATCASVFPSASCAWSSLSLSPRYDDAASNLVNGAARPNLKSKPFALGAKRESPNRNGSSLELESIRFLSSSPWALVRSPAATASSTRFLRACLSALLSWVGVTPSCLAASLMTAWLSARGDQGFVAAIATPPPATASAAREAPTSFSLAFRLTPYMRPAPSKTGLRAV